ncbi:MAG: peptidoglycan DD-metalloendopeptidase family protein [Acidimicrobiia bacterium]
MFRKRAKISILILCFILVMPISTAYAKQINRTSAASDPRIDKLKGDLEYVSKQEAQEVAKYLDLKAKSQKATSDLASLDKKIKTAEAAKKTAQDQANSARAEFAAAQQKYDDATKKSNDAQERKKLAIIRIYQNSTDTDSLPSIISAEPEDREDVIRKTTLMQKYKDSQGVVIEEAKKLADDAAKEKLLHEDARIRAEAAEKVAAEEEASLVPLRADLASAQKKAKDAEAAEQAVVNSLKSKKSDYNKQIAQLVAESNALAAAIRNKQNTNVVVQPGKMRKPVSAPITSYYGMRTHPIYGDQRLHAGVDFGASYGAPIVAAKDGKVIYASQMSGYGNVIIIDHGGGISTLYAHQSSFAVGNGQQVKQGQVIGYVGATGQVTGPHLHFEVRSNGTPVDPMGYF